MATIGLLYHPRDRVWPPRGPSASLLEHIARFHADSHEVVAVTEPHRAAEVDVLVNHVDLTRTPDHLASALQAHPRTVNGRVLDISKRRTSDLVLAEGEDWDGPVIVKTDRNACGYPEERLLLGPVRRTWSRLRRLRESRTGRLRRAQTMRWGRYPVLDRATDVPRAVWRNEALVVERFLPERVGAHHAIRSYVFMGDRGFAVRQVASTRVVKANTVVRSEPVEVPPELERRRHDLGFDHGKFDYVMVEGVPRVLDANRTPWLWIRSQRHRDMVEYLAPGLDPLLIAAE